VVLNDVTFGIPLVSRRVARSWPSVEQLLGATLRSVFNQTDANIRVIIACHERPDIVELLDKRVTIKQVEFDIPRFRWEMEIDRMRKLEVIGSELRSLGAGWLFILDADDFVSKHLAREVVSSKVKALMIRRGYRLDAKSGRYQDLGKLWGKCGSCAAVRWDENELPLKPLSDNPPIYHEFCEHRHFLLPTFFASREWSWRFLEAPLVTYVVNHGSNQSEVIVRDTIKWRLYFKLRKWKTWTRELDDEFGVTAEKRAQGVYTGSNQFSTEIRH
jgi:hypothetical protein